MRDFSVGHLMLIGIHPDALILAQDSENCVHQQDLQQSRSHGDQRYSEMIMRVSRSLLIGVSALAFAACAEEHGRSYWLRHATITLPQAAQIAEASESGRAVGAELKQSGTRVFYEIEVITSASKSRRVRVDAETGKIITGLNLP